MDHFTDLLAHPREQADGPDQPRRSIIGRRSGAHLVFVDQGLDGMHMPLTVSHIDARHEFIAQGPIILTIGAIRMHHACSQTVILAQLLAGFEALPETLVPARRRNKLQWIATR